jgi:protein TonB
MTQGGFYQQKKMSPGAIAIVVLLHGAAITAVALAREGMPAQIKPLITTIDFLNPDKDPPPHPQPKHEEPKKEILTTVRTELKVKDPPTVPDPPRPMDFPTTVTTVALGTGTIDLPPVPPPPPPPQPVKSQSARAKSNLAGYVSDADYPSDAIRREEQGTTRFRLAVGPDGRVSDCMVTGSSGSAALDLATCRLMKSRARFAPARDSTGNAVADAVSSAINWRLPSG